MIFRDIDGFGSVGGEAVQRDAFGVGGERKLPIAVTDSEPRPPIRLGGFAGPRPEDGPRAPDGIAVERTK